MSSAVETSLKRFLHSLRSVEMTVGVNMYIVPLNYSSLRLSDFVDYLETTD